MHEELKGPSQEALLLIIIHRDEFERIILTTPFYGMSLKFTSARVNPTLRLKTCFLM